MYRNCAQTKNEERHESPPSENSPLASIPIKLEFTSPLGPTLVPPSGHFPSPIISILTSNHSRFVWSVFELRVSEVTQ